MGGLAAVGVDQPPGRDRGQPPYVEKLVRECSNGGRLHKADGEACPGQGQRRVGEVQPIHGIARDSNVEGFGNAHEQASA